MTQKFRQTGQVLANDCISDGIYSMLLQTDRIAEAAAPDSSFLSTAGMPPGCSPDPSPSARS